jgi:hypothetical protein
MRAGRQSIIGLAVAAVASLGMACGGGTAPRNPAENDPMPNLDRGTALAWQARPTIVQTVRLLNPGLRTGDTLMLESTLRNVSRQTVNVNRVVCELDLDTTMSTESPFIHCLIYSHDGPLAPGEVATSTLHRVVTAPPGRYTISVRHLLDPSVWVPAELTIRPR